MLEQNDKWIADFDMEWWNSEYKEPTPKNDLGVDAVSKGFCDWYDEIKYADTIIEAESEVGNGNNE